MWQRLEIGMVEGFRLLDDAERVAREVLGNPRYQKIIPAPSSPSRSWRWLAAFGPIANIVFILGLIALGVGLVLMIVRMLDRDSSRAPDEETLENKPTVLPSFDIDMDEIAALVEKELFAEAMHRLLLLTFVELARRTGQPLAEAATSREILSAFDIEPRARTALADLIGAVEISHFGGRPADIDDYRAAMRRFETLRNVVRGNVS